VLYLVVFLPLAAVEELLEALFAAGAGRLGRYDRCAFVQEGQGRFRPLAGAAPAIGAAPAAGQLAGEDVRVAEARIELLVPESRAGAVEAALRSAHPYEEPAFYFFAVKGPVETDP
jgi:hypothetical protein